MRRIPESCVPGRCTHILRLSGTRLRFGEPSFASACWNRRTRLSVLGGTPIRSRNALTNRFRVQLRLPLIFEMGVIPLLIVSCCQAHLISRETVGAARIFANRYSSRIVKRLRQSGASKSLSTRRLATLPNKLDNSVARCASRCIGGLQDAMSSDRCEINLHGDTG